MKTIYKVAGMTCNNCKASVEKSLQNLENVTDAKVDLKAQQVTIESSKSLDINVLQNALEDKYKISKATQNVFKEEEEDSNKLKQLFPLFLIFAYLIIASILLNIPWSSDAFMLDFMGLFYIVFSFFKLLDLKGFPTSFRMYDPLAQALPVYAWVYPFIEVALGLMFLMRIEIKIALIITTVVLGITTVGVIRILLNKKAIQCACLGTALKLPMTTATFIENSIMLVMAIIMLL